MGKFSDKYNALMKEIEDNLAYIIYEKSIDRSKYFDSNCIKLDRVLESNLTRYDEIVLVFGEPQFSDTGYTYGLSTIPFEELCDIVDELNAYYDKIDEFQVKESYTEDEVNEMTLEEMYKVPLTKNSLQLIDIIMEDEENYSDEEYIEEYRKAIKAEYVNKK